jgi:hypothetical protein
VSRGIHTLPGQGQTNDWITPPWIPKLFGHFDLDPCASVTQPFHHALREYTIEDDGLVQPWVGRVWLNPPYGRAAEGFIRKLSEHGNGIALIAARVETDWFHRWVWQKADAVMFPRGRFSFWHPNGEPSKANSGHPSVLVAYGEDNVVWLQRAAADPRLLGVFVDLRSEDVA